VPDDRDVFAALTALVIERCAAPEDLERFRELLRAHPEFIDIFRRQIMLATLLPALSSWEKPDEKPCEEQEAAANAAPRRVSARWPRIAAAAAAVLLVGGLVRYGVSRVSELRPASPGLRPPITVSPVHVVRQWGSAGLELPDALPGALRLGNGLAVVRLESGVELTLLGPVTLEVRDAMRVRLEAGRLLAEVPPVASGFTVLTAELEIYDLGTVFGVSAEGRSSGVFVFKGSVQVNEASGEPVDLCEAGQGVRAFPGTRPLKVAADWPEAQKVFAAVRGTAALADPTEAFDAADRIAALWARRYMPTVVPPPPPPVAGLRGGRQLAVNGKQSAVGNRQSGVGNRQSGVSNHTTLASHSGLKTGIPPPFPH